MQSPPAWKGKKEAQGIVMGPSKPIGPESTLPRGSVEPLNDWEVLKEVYTFVKPAGSKEFRARASAALGLLIASKVLNVQVPFLFKHTGRR